MRFDGIDIVLDRSFSLDAIQNVLALVFETSPSRIAVVNDLRDAAVAPDQLLVAVATSVEGEFSQLVSIHMDATEIAFNASGEVLGALARCFDATCLGPDESVNPYTMLCARRDGTVTAVWLDPNALDEDRYVIARRSG